MSLPKLTDAQKQTKLRSGIQPLQIIMNTNYLAKSQFPLTSDLFEFPYLSNKPSNLEKYPLISTNVKYDASRIRFLTHVERFQIVFGMSRLLQFISDLPIEDDSQKSEVLKHNTEFMLDMLFPMSYPVIKQLKMASNQKFSISAFDAIKKEAAYQKFNTYLKLDGKSCTVDEIRFMDTFGANPIYVKLYDFAKDFLVKRDAAIPVLRADINTRLNEFNVELGKKMSIALRGITSEIVKMYNSSLSVTADKTKLNAEKLACDKELAETRKKRTALEELEIAQKELLRYKGSGTGYTSVKNTIETHLPNHYKTIFTKSRSPVISIDTTLANATDTINKVEIQIKALESEKTKKTPAQIENIDLLIEGYTKLIDYVKILNGVRNAFGIKPGDSIAVLFGKIDKLTDLQKEISKIEQEEKEKTKECADIDKKINSSVSVDLTFISAALPTETDVENALANPTKDADFKRLQSSNISVLITDYIFIKRTLFDDVYKGIATKLATLAPATIETIKNEIKTMYDDNQQYFSQRNPLTEAFMKLRKICGFAYLITSMHQYQENLNIEREYSINYNIDADLKKGEYLFHRTISESLRAYYYPNRQSMEPAIKVIVSVKDTDPINMDAIVDMFENDPTTPAAIDLVDLQGKPRYECQCSIYLVGGIITPENSSKIDCSYQDRIIGANLLKERFNLIVPEFTDLTQHIAEMEKKYDIKYEKKKLEDYSLGGAVLTAGPGLGGSGPMPTAPVPMPPVPPVPGMPAAPPPKKAAFTVSDTDLERIIGSHMPSGSLAIQLKDFIKTKGYEKVKEFLESAVDYSEKTKPNPSDYADAATKTTYRDSYEEKKIDAESTINTMINKKKNELKRPTLTSTEIGMLGREIGMLKALQTVIGGVDKLFDKMWSVRGGKKTRKHRRKRSRKTRRSLI
jgi:hypothetical protein